MTPIKLNTIGCDIELFLRDKSNGEPVSAEGIIRGSKYDPYQFDEDNPYFATSLDNVAVEFCCPPATNSREWVAYLNKSLAYIKSVIPKNLDLLIAPSANFDERFLQTEQARNFGESLPS